MGQAGSEDCLRRCESPRAHETAGTAIDLTLVFASNADFLVRPFDIDIERLTVRPKLSDLEEAKAAAGVSTSAGLA